ncbi:hypothetical protein ALSL_2384 [Aerosticca soli]|uniref:Uncharacterized protein n=1 Tax=Aerosticca soli TaxID=2010829 RepID=A0A2Z6E8V4_9GAMM|nr:hypothetical protein ALSL_2384 [Aerosticca soli]
MDAHGNSGRALAGHDTQPNPTAGFRIGGGPDARVRLRAAFR